MGTIVTRRAVQLELIRALAEGLGVEEAVVVVAHRLCVAEEAVREVVAELEGASPMGQQFDCADVEHGMTPC